MKELQFKLPGGKTLRVELEETVLVNAFLLKLKEDQILDSTKPFILSSLSGSIISESTPFRFLQDEMYLITEQSPDAIIVQEEESKLKQQFKNKSPMDSEISPKYPGNVIQNTEPRTGDKIIIPPGKLAAKCEDHNFEKRRNVALDNSSVMNTWIKIPRCKFMSDDPLAKRAKEIKKKIQEGNSISISKTGEVNPTLTDTSKTGKNIQIPPGKLANFYWYQRDRELYEAEIEAMNLSFPAFKLKKLDDGRLYWEGDIQPKVWGNTSYRLLIVYDNNHPSTSTYGGSVKCYLVDPSIEELEAKHGRVLPHIMKDTANNRYLCTNSTEIFKDSATHSTSASTCLRWAVKWLLVYELFDAKEISYTEFSSHDKF